MISKSRLNQIMSSQMSKGYSKVQAYHYAKNAARMSNPYRNLEPKYRGDRYQYYYEKRLMHYKAKNMSWPEAEQRAIIDVRAINPDWRK